MISEGLDTLKNMAHDMNEVKLSYKYWFICLLKKISISSFAIHRHVSSFSTRYMQELDRQVPLMDEIDTKVSNISIALYNFKKTLGPSYSYAAFMHVCRWTKRQQILRIQMLDLKTL